MFRQPFIKRKYFTLVAIVFLLLGIYLFYEDKRPPYCQPMTDSSAIELAVSAYERKSEKNKQASLWNGIVPSAQNAFKVTQQADLYDEGFSGRTVYFGKEGNQIVAYVYADCVVGWSN